MPWRIKEPRMKNPRGGWRWTEMGVTITEDTPDQLANHIEKMRRANDIPVGDPMEEIAESLSASDPWLVRYEPDKNRKAQKKDPLIDAVERWTFDRVKTAHSFIHQFDAKQRADVCRKCPKAKRLIQPTEEESARYWKSLMIASQGKCASEISHGTGACSLYGHDNRLAIWLESPHSEQKCCGNAGEKPRNCWI